MLDGSDSCNHGERNAHHPFAVDDPQSNSAFSVVSRGQRGQIATANSNEDSRHHRTRGSIQNSNDFSSNRQSEILSYRSRNLDTNNACDSNTHNNANCGANSSVHFDSQTVGARCSRTFCGNNNNKNSARLRADAIGPGVILEDSSFHLNRTQNESNRTYLSSHSSKILRHRGKRTNMPPQGTIPNESDGHSSGTRCSQHSLQNCRNPSCNGQEISPTSNGNVISHRNRTRLTNDLELLSRPSWCDAKFAYEQVVQGKAHGNKHALWFRSKVHQLLFRLGCFVQRRAWFVLIPCLMVLAACAIGLKYGTLETEVENLWVESGGKLEEELEYTKKSIGEGLGATWQILIQTGEDTATIESMKLHLAAARAATEIKVTVYDQDWEISDLCYKEVPDMGESSFIIETFIQKLFPCFIMGPLDCFYEGAELLGPSTPFPAMKFNGVEIPAFTWKNLYPKELLDMFSSIHDVREFSELVQEAGVDYGYQNRWCLDPYNAECPELAPNKYTKELPDVKSLINAGCEGYATKFMKWPNDLIVGGIERDEDGNITKSHGLQTLIQLMGPTNMFDWHKNTIKVQNIKWDLDKATNVLTLWQRKFVEEMYKVKVNASSFHSNPDEIHAFAPSTAQDLILEFSNFSYLRVAAGYFLMLVYACFTMLRCKASRSQGAVGIIGVLLVALSVMAGLGICSVIGIKFNAATTQVLPFLMLGLGVDDMFLITHQFGEIACLNYIPFEERTGECMKRVGVSVLLTSIAILSGFLFSMIIPMPALQSFALQAAIITCFNLFCVLFVFPAALSVDLLRRKKNMLDIFCCFKSSSANDVIELSDFNHEVATQSPPSCNTSGSLPPQPQPVPVAHFTTLPAGPQHPDMDSEATITMHHTIQAYSNESFVTFLGPAAETTISSTNPQANGAETSQVPQYYPPMTPPPKYTPEGNPQITVTPDNSTLPKTAFEYQSESNGVQVTTTSSNPKPNVIHTRSNPSKSKLTPSTTAASSNLVTPMVSVRSSTHSLVPTARSKASKWFRWSSNKQKSRRESEYTGCFPFVTVSEFAKKYYGPFLIKTPVRIFVLTLCGLILGGSIYGCLQVRDGLELVDILPRDTREHDALSAQLEYFSFYNMLIVTKDIDYAHKQRELHELHHNISQLKHVVRNTDGTKTKFWLEYMREWLSNLQDSFDKDWSLGYINETTWKPHASDEGVLAFKLLLQTGKLEETTDFGRIGCEPPNNKPCQKVNIVRLVSDDGIIREDAFYNYLTAWTQLDPLAYIASLAEMVPNPLTWTNERGGNLIIPRSRAVTYAQMPYFLNGLQENDDFVEVIISVRALCDHYEAEGVESYPTGYPFLFWQQYIDLREWLFIAMGTAILAISSVVAIVLLNPWAAGITCLFLITITTELLGFMGIAGIKLSAVPAVILVAAIGLGVEFTVHITLAFITSCGSREDRSKAAITHMMGPVIDGAISTFLGVVMLSGSEFDFIVRYFFQVLAVLVLIGLWNGIVVLPVVLSFIGPPPEVVPLGGGSRLKTPTPPPTPAIEENDRVCRHNCNNSNHTPRYHRHTNDCCGHCTSRDDSSYMQRRGYGYQDPYFHPSYCHTPTTHRYPHHRPAFYPDPRFQYQINPGYCHPHSVGTSGSSTPRATLDDGRVLIYPDFVVYSSNPNSTNHAHLHHCDSPVRVSRNQDQIVHQGTMDNNKPNASSNKDQATSSNDMGQHIATLTSSVTVKVRPARRQHCPVYLPPSSYQNNHSSTESSTMETNFQPITDQKSIDPDRISSNRFPPDAFSKPVPLNPADERSNNFSNNSEFRNVVLSETSQNSPNVDEASEAVDTAFQRLGNHDVNG
ncbi:protein patched homolog 1-like [Styela clava]